MKSRFAILVLAIVAFACHTQRKEDAPPSAGAASPAEAAAVVPVAVELFVMSQCPYGVEAETAFFPAVRALGDAVTFRLDFIGDEIEAGRLISMHGESEVAGDLLHVCALQANPSLALDLIACMNREYARIPENFDACADEVKADRAAILACAEGEAGQALLRASFARAEERGADGSPTVLVGGQPYAGPRTKDGLMRAVCQAFQGTRPAVCDTVPEPTKVTLKVITDARFQDCAQMARIGIEQLSTLFPGLQAEVVEYATPEGAALYEAIRGTEQRFLPAFLFGPEVTQDPGWQQIGDYLVEAGDWRVLSVDAPFDPTAEICDNGVDDDANALVDCKDPACAPRLLCRTPTPGTLDLFIMSQCPYGVQAVDAMREVLDAFGRGLKFRIHYIADEVEPGEFVSLHGPGEVAEDIRQLCAIRHYPKRHQYMDFLWCRNAAPDGDWRACAKGAIKASVIEKCAMSGEGRKLLSASAKFGNDLGVNGSPTWLVNNHRVFSGLSPEDIRIGFCEANPGTQGCDKTLTGDVGLPDGGCQAQ